MNRKRVSYSEYYGYRGTRYIRRYFSCRECGSISMEEAYELIESDPNAVIIDVRSYQEYDEGNLCSSINIPIYDLERHIEKIIPDKETVLITYCESGIRSEDGAEALKAKGYTNAYHIYVE
ncbi:MAG: rhodanese-like domain-containing protein [Oscillospiraceae bacterium]|nr:rhodanese-like domain-containing protein [Oscillospiraceae bacterium]